MTVKKQISHNLDPVTFARESLQFYPDPWQRDVLKYKGSKLIMLASRQSGKSAVAAVKALHRALFFPDSLILLISPSMRQSQLIFRTIGKEMGKVSDQPKKVEDNKLSMTLANGSRIVSLPSAEGTIRGYSSPDLIIIDEASRVQDGIYYTLRPMMAISGGQLILLSTPNGRQGFFFEAWTKEDDWLKIKVTAAECPRISPEFLQQELETLGKWWCDQEYQCVFVEGEDAVFRYEEIQRAFRDDYEGIKLWEDDQDGF